MAASGSIRTRSSLEGLAQSATLAINERVNQLRRAGREICHLGFGQSPFPVHPLMREALATAADRQNYAPVMGLIELREAICSFHNSHYDYDFSPDRVLVGPGSKELIFQALFVLEGPLILPTPCWVSYEPQARLCGKQVLPVHTSREEGYKLTAEQLDAACRELQSAQKLLILNSPNNPTGGVYTDKELRSLADLCRTRNVIVISDEIYSMLSFDGAPAKGIGLHLPERTLTAGGISKAHSAGGYRLGFLAVPREMAEVARQLATVASETFSCVATPIQAAGVVAFSDSPEILAYIRLCKSLHAAASGYVHQRVAEAGISCVRPAGAFYLFPDFQTISEPLVKAGITNSLELCKFLLEEFGVAALPGSTFGRHPAELSVRLAVVDYDGEAAIEAAQAGQRIDVSFADRFFPSLRNACDRLVGFAGSFPPGRATTVS